jgi:hypothetical protein
VAPWKKAFSPNFALLPKYFLQDAELLRTAVGLLGKKPDSDPAADQAKASFRHPRRDMTIKSS